MNNRIDRWLVFSTVMLLALSGLMVFSTTAMLSRETFGTSYGFVRLHLLHILLGTVTLLICYRLNPRVLQKLSVPLMVVIMTLLCLVLIPQIGHQAGGARRWLVLGAFRAQPGELAKVVLILYIASYIGRHRAEMTRFSKGVFIPMVIIGLASILLLLEPDFGSTVIVVSVVFSQLLTASRLSHLVMVGLTAVSGLLLLAITSPYRLRRLESFMDPFKDPSSSGYQLIQSLIAVGSGGVSGAGLGAGKQKLFYLPAAHTDFIFAVIAEELGMLGAIAVIALFLVVALRGLMHAKRLYRDPFLCSLAVGFTLLIVLPAFLNMGVVLGMFPTKGLVLPLVAYGGTAMIVHLGAMGVLLRLSTMETQ